MNYFALSVPGASGYTGIIVAWNTVPDRTIDVDSAIRLPYRGEKVNVGNMLKGLGLEEVINHSDGAVLCRSGESSVEFLKDRQTVIIEPGQHLDCVLKISTVIFTGRPWTG
jgi:hypothetical protein